MGHVYLYTGTGGGKTANALGLALRSVGQEHKGCYNSVFEVEEKYWRI